MQSNVSLWQELSSTGLVKGEEPTVEPESPWFIKLLLSISGWLGALFWVIAFGFFMSMIFGRNIEDFPLILTIIGGGAIYLVYQQFQEKKSDFLEHFFLALSMAGQVLVIASIVIMLDHYIMEKGIYLFTAFFQAFLMWFIPNYIHRIMNSFFMALALSFFFYTVHLAPLYLAALTFVMAWLWMNEFYFDAPKKIQAIAYGQLAVLLLLNTSSIYSYDILNFYRFTSHKISTQLFPFSVEIFSTLALAYIAWKILAQNNKLEDKKLLIFSFVTVVLLGILSVKVSGLVTGIMLLLIGFSSSHRLLIGLGVLSSLFFISNYYYFTGETLLDKSIVLVTVGLLLLIIRWVVKMFVFKEVLDA